MPYITQEDRQHYDALINLVIDQLDNVKRKQNNALVDPGHLNYIITRICLAVFNQNTSYRAICLITGVLENVKQELYRRKFSDYEDTKIEENGDL